MKCNGSLVNTSDTVQHGAVYSLEPRLRGGKGGRTNLSVFLSITWMLGYLKGHVMQTLGMYPLDRELPSAGKHFSILHGSRGQGRKAEILLSPFPLERPTARRCESKPLK